MEENSTKHTPQFIPQIGIPEKTSFQERNYTRAIYHKATAPGFFGVIVLCFFMAFINIKCNGRVMASYTGMEIVSGIDKSEKTNNGATIIGVRQSAYFQFKIAKENFRWKKNLAEDFETYSDEAPYNENDFSAAEDFNKMPERFEDTTTNPQRTRLLATIALLSALAGIGLVFLKGKWGIFFQILLGFTGFVSLMLMQLYVKVTLPKASSSKGPLFSEYDTPMITTEFALGYWIALFLFLAVLLVGLFKFRFLKRVSGS
jgi:hypothetical protein